MAKKQTRRSISVSRSTYERLKAFCETNNISMSQLVETRVNDFLGVGEVVPASLPATQAPVMQAPVRTMPADTFRMPPMAPRTAAPVMPVAPRSYEQRVAPAPVAPTPVVAAPAPVQSAPAPAAPAAPVQTTSSSVPMTSAAARFAVDPPPPIIKPRQDTAAPKPAEKRPDQIFTF